jgi:hypothetical protein
LIATLASIRRFTSAFITRQIPTLIPNLCQGQFGTLGIVTTSAGEIR